MIEPTFTRCALCVLVVSAAAGCKGQEPAATPGTGDATPAPAPTVPVDAPAAADAGSADAEASELRIECPGGEKSATARAITPESAELVIAHAGHFSQTYRFTFAGERLTQATRDDVSWSFSGGLPDNPETRDKVKRVAYTFDASEAPTCESRSAEGPSKEIAALLDRAPAKKEPCDKPAAVQGLATQVRAGAAGQPELTRLVCR